MHKPAAASRRPTLNRTPIILLLLALLTPGAPAATKTNPIRRAPAVPSLVLAPAAVEQLAATALTYLGDYVCDLDQRLQVSLNPRFDGYVDVLFDKKTDTMKPILSTTGAVRLEDVRGRLLLLQIAQKSMLLDVKSGRRLVDDCVHEQQAENRRVMDAAPPLPGLGIVPAPAPTLEPDQSAAGPGNLSEAPPMAASGAASAP